MRFERLSVQAGAVKRTHSTLKQIAHVLLQDDQTPFLNGVRHGICILSGVSGGIFDMLSCRRPATRQTRGQEKH
jgi:hypothetical protein